jgi:hypothetical protein
MLLTQGFNRARPDLRTRRLISAFGGTRHKPGVLKRSLLFALLYCMPLTDWALVKPVRVVETVAGVSCADNAICTDDPSRNREAAQLYEDALRYVASTITPLQHRPLVIFCTTEACYQSFGYGKSTAMSIGSFLIIVGPRAWTPYYLRHEMIHRLQTEQLGELKMLQEPDWFIEGMAYSLSQDPHAELAEPFQDYRSRFQDWYRGVGRERLWNEAARL